MVYLSNAFSIQMLPETGATVQVVPVTPDQVVDALGEKFISAVGHQDTAAVVSTILGVEVPMNRVNVHLDLGDTLFVAQIMGGRLPEGATTLPEGVELRFFRVTLL